MSQAFYSSILLQARHLRDTMLFVLPSAPTLYRDAQLCELQTPYVWCQSLSQRAYICSFASHTNASCFFKYGSLPPQCFLLTVSEVGSLSSNTAILCSHASICNPSVHSKQLVSHPISPILGSPLHVPQHQQLACVMRKACMLSRLACQYGCRPTKYWLYISRRGCLHASAHTGHNCRLDQQLQQHSGMSAQSWPLHAIVASSEIRSCYTPLTRCPPAIRRSCTCISSSAASCSQAPAHVAMKGCNMSHCARACSDSCVEMLAGATCSGMASSGAKMAIVAPLLAIPFEQRAY